MNYRLSFSQGLVSALKKLDKNENVSMETLKKDMQRVRRQYVKYNKAPKTSEDIEYPEDCKYPHYYICAITKTAHSSAKNSSWPLIPMLMILSAFWPLALRTISTG